MYITTYFESEIKENESIEYTRFSEVDTEGYEETWENSRQREKVFVVDTLMKEKRAFFLNKNVSARFLSYTLNSAGNITSMRVVLKRIILIR